MPAAPQSPSLKLPQQVTDLSASRTADVVTLHWMMPRRTTDKVILKGDQDAHICRRLENGPCQAAGDLRISPAAPAEFTDHLPADLVTGPPRLLTYFVELRNRAKRTAGLSNPAYTASGVAPASVMGLAANVSPDGIILRWQAAGKPGLVCILRVLVPKAGASVKPEAESQMAGVPQPVEQMLEVTALDHTIDKDAAYDNTYRYTVERVQKLTLAKHNFEVIGQPSQMVTVLARDVFPPKTPTGLAAVADTEGRAIDLSWSAGSEQDLAGYTVYRREAGANGRPTRISPAAPVPGPSFRDRTALPGVHYDYSVSAIDRDGNESPRSGEVEEELPN